MYDENNEFAQQANATDTETAAAPETLEYDAAPNAEYTDGDDLNTKETGTPFSFEAYDTFGEDEEAGYDENVELFEKKYTVTDPLSRSECAKLHKRCYSKRADVRKRAQDTLVAQYEFYVLAVLKHRFPSANEHDLKDLQQEAWKKIWEDFPKYDAKKGNISNFIYYRIMGAGSLYIIKFTKQSSTSYERKRKAVQMCADSFIQAGISPTYDRIARELGLSTSLVAKILDSRRIVASLEDYEGITPSNADTPEEAVIKKDMYRDLYAALDVLGATSPERATMLKMSFGIGDYKIHTNREIASLFGATEAYVKDAIERAIAALGAMSKLQQYSERTKVQRDLGMEPLCAEPTGAAQTMFDAICADDAPDFEDEDLPL